MQDFNTQYNFYLNQTEILMNELIPSSGMEDINEPFRYIMSGGGKKIRPVLTLMCCGAMGSDPIKALHAACSIEILHNFTLVHDDIMDKSPMRRGKPTIHNKWDEATAILTGDIMVGYAYKALEHYHTHERCGEIYSTLTRGLIDVCEGQVMDMRFNTNRNVSISDYLIMIEKKTSKILETCALMGGLVGYGSDWDLSLLSSYAINLGLAFQIQDDVLDLTADETEFGKHIGQDIIEGKKTYLILTAKERVKSDSDRELLRNFFSNNGLPEEEVPAMREMMVRLNIIDEATTVAQSYFEKAKDIIGKLNLNTHVEMLKMLAESLNKRSK